MPDTFGIKGFIPVSLLDWPGKVTSILFLAGCGFRCPACHNHQLVLDPDSLPDYPVARILGHLNRKKGWIDGVTITGGEPTLRRELPFLLAKIKALGFQTKLDTNGTNPRMLKEIIGAGFVDAVSMDVKAPLTEEEYSRMAGVSVRLDAIRESIDILRSSPVDETFRTTVVPGYVEESELERIVEYLGDVKRYRVQAFRNTDTLSPKFAEISPFPLDRFERMRTRFQRPRTATDETLAHAV